MVLEVLAMTLAMQDAPSIEACRTQANTLELNECGAARVALERERMQRYLAASRVEMMAYQEMTPPEYEVDLAAQLDAAQQAWDQYAEAHCRTVYDMNIGGTIRGIMYLGCMETAIHDRTLQLWTDILADSEDALPEPGDTVAKTILGE